MIALLGRRPFETEDSYESSMLGVPTPAPLPSAPTKNALKGEPTPLPLGEGIEAGAGVPIPQPAVASSKAPQL
jgi:hypothetical protein